MIYAIEHGVHGYGVSDFRPSTAVFIGLVPLLLFNYVGFELQSGAAEEMVDPQRDVPVAVARGGVIAILCYLIPIFGIVAVLPTNQVTGIAGFLDAVDTTFTVYGSAHHILIQLMALMFIFALATGGAAWIIGSDRVLAVAGYDGAFAGYFGVFHDRLGTPVRVNVLSGIVSTVFMISAQLLNSGSNANTFVVVLYMATSTGLLSYILIFPALIKLRYSHGDVARPYRIPFGMAGVWICGGLRWDGSSSAPGSRSSRTHRESGGCRLQLPGLLGDQPDAVRGVHPGHAGRDRGDRDRRLCRRRRRAPGSVDVPLDQAAGAPPAGALT